MNKLIISELFEKLDLFSEQCGSIDDPEEVKASLLLVNHLQNTLLFIEKQLILVPQSLNNNSEQISLTERLKKRNKWWKWVEESADYIFPEAIKGAPVRNDPHSCIAYWCDDLKKDINDISLKSIYRDERQLARWLNEYRNAVRAGYDWKKEEDPDYQFLDDYGFDWNPRENRKQTLMQTFYMFMKGAEKVKLWMCPPLLLILEQFGKNNVLVNFTSILNQGIRRVL